jgi:DNA segregation ATPase FtsK/SpoIIIE, S-DNA-T family
MDVVIRTPHGDAEVRVGAHDPATRLVDVLEVVTGRSVPPVVDVDGRAVPSAAPLDDAGVLEGSVIDVGAGTGDGPDSAGVELVQIAGWGTGTRAALPSGTYRIGPGRRVNARELAAAPVDRVGFELRVAAGGAVTVTTGQDPVRLDGAVLEPGARVTWATGVVDVLGRAFQLEEHTIGPLRRPRPDPGSATATFNRPPLPSPSPPVSLPAAGAAVVRDHGRRPGAHQRPAVDERRALERDRLRAAWVLPAEAGELAGSAGPALWRRRHSPTEPVELAVGLGDVPWRPVGVEGDHGTLPMVPITVDLAREQGLAIVGSTDFVRAAARGVLVAAAVERGPADLAIVVATHADRLGAWEWVKWLPHCRTAGTIDVLTSAEAIAAVLDTAARPGPLTLVVADEPAWWRERAAPLRPLLAGTRSPIRLIALVGDPAEAPTVCTTLLSESDDVAVLDRLLDRQRIERVHPFLVATETALGTARHLAGLDDPDLAPPEDDPAHRRAPVLELLQLTEPGGVPLAGRVMDRWSGGDRAPTLLPVGRDGATTITIDLDRHGPHLVVAGPEAPDVTRGLLAALAVVAAPDEVGIVLIGPTATFGRCTDLPHVVGTVTHPDGGEAERVLRCLRAELRRRSSGDDDTDESGARLVVVLDEPTARDMPGFGSAVSSIARDGASLGIHLIVATDRPAGAFDDELGRLDVARLEVASRLGELTTRPRARSSLRIAAGPAVELDPVTSRTPSTHPPPPDAPEIAPFVVGRELTPMERRLARGLHPDAASGPAGAFDGLVMAIARAAAETGRLSARPCVPPPLPDVITLAALLDADLGDDVPWAVADLPDEQRHAVRRWSPSSGAGILVTGARGVATSWPIATLTLGAAARVPNDTVRVHVVGDGSGGLDELARLPDVHTCVGVDRLDNVATMLAALAEEVTARHDLPPRARTAGLTPAHVLMIDDLGGLRLRLRARADLSRAWDDLERILRFGAEVGIAVVATARDRHDLPPGLEAPFATRLLVDDAAGAPTGRAVELTDGEAVVQLAEPPPSLRHAVDEVLAEHGGEEPPRKHGGEEPPSRHGGEEPPLAPRRGGR